MKHFAVKTSKRFISGILMSLVFLFVPTVVNFLSDSFNYSYYANSPATVFLADVDIVVEDMCLGESTQIWFSTRKVGIANGLDASLTRELYKVVILQDGTKTQAKIYEESKDIFIDPVSTSTRLQYYQRPLDLGEYIWKLRYNEIRLPSGVVRTDYPIINTNTFQVMECDTI